MKIKDIQPIISIMKLEKHSKKFNTLISNKELFENDSSLQYEYYLDKLNEMEDWLKEIGIQYELNGDALEFYDQCGMSSDKSYGFLFKNNADAIVFRLKFTGT